jgi:hypothetical protein
MNMLIQRTLRLSQIEASRVVSCVFISEININQSDISAAMISSSANLQETVVNATGPNGSSF